MEYLYVPYKYDIWNIYIFHMLHNLRMRIWIWHMEYIIEINGKHLYEIHLYEIHLNEIHSIEMEYISIMYSICHIHIRILRLCSNTQTHQHICNCLDTKRHMNIQKRFCICKYIYIYEYVKHLYIPWDWDYAAIHTHTHTQTQFDIYKMSCLYTENDTFIDTLRLHCNTHCNALQHTATYCNTLQHTATHVTFIETLRLHCNTLQHTATHCNALQHTATHCNTLQHPATPCNTRHFHRHFEVTLQHAPNKRVYDCIYTKTYVDTFFFIYKCVIFKTSCIFYV